MTRRAKLVTVLLVVLLPLGLWLVANPPGCFGWCGFGYSIYGACPHIISDLQIRADGTTRTVSKTHDLTFEQIEWLLRPQPEVLIIALGWDGVTTPDERIRSFKGCEVRMLKNKEGLELFNRLKASGKRVAIHYHSTC